MKNKKGFLLGEETVKIVIAVICIAFLVTLLVLVYLSATGTQKTREATLSIENVIQPEIEKLNEGGEANTNGNLIQNPAGWYIFSFVDGDKKPNSCIQENCICICQNILINVFDRQIKSCDEKGICYPVSNLKKFDKIGINNEGTGIFIRKINEFIYISKNEP
jgi:hypothetical protein